MKNINSPVMITAVGFDRRMGAFPRRMEWRGQSYHFVDRGVTVRGRRGNTITLSDGRQQFCLRSQGGLWTLLSVG